MKSSSAIRKLGGTFLPPLSVLPCLLISLLSPCLPLSVPSFLSSIFNHVELLLSFFHSLVSSLSLPVFLFLPSLIPSSSALFLFSFLLSVLVRHPYQMHQDCYRSTLE